MNWQWPWRCRLQHAAIGKPLLLLWRLLDALSPKRMDHWALFDHPVKRGQLIENTHAIYAHLRACPQVQMHVFFRGEHSPEAIQPSANTHLHRLDTLRGLLALTRCGVLLLTNSIAMDMSLRWSNGSYSAPRLQMRGRILVNLWHGIPLKRLFALANPHQRAIGDRNLLRRQERAHYAGLVASSDVDAYAMAAIFHPIPPANVWPTGLPRNDFLRCPEQALPPALTSQLLRLRHLCHGRRLVLYAPTYRDGSATGARSYCFSDAELSALAGILARNNAVLGVREHYVRNAPAPFTPAQIGASPQLLSLDHDRFQEIAPLLRVSELVVTDYSSVYIDAMYLKRPVLAFAHDLSDYMSRQNGLLYDPELAFPGPLTTTFDGFIAALEQRLSAPSFDPDERYLQARNLFFRHNDACNTQRVVDRIHATIAGRCTQ